MRNTLLWVVGLALMIGMLLATSLMLMVVKMNLFEPFAIAMLLTAVGLTAIADKLFRKVYNTILE
jgi:hypothetical protein